MKDILVVALLVLGFAFVLTVHVSIALGLLSRKPRWRGLVALFIPVLGVYWAWTSDMRRRAIMFLIGLAIYVVALVLAYT